MSTRAVEVSLGSEEIASSSALIPLSLTLVRAELALVIACLAHLSPSSTAFGLCLAAVLVTDVLGRLTVHTLAFSRSSLVRLGNLVDLGFCFAALYATWMLYPDVLRRHSGALVVLFAIVAVRYTIDLAKFGRETGYHTWIGRVWGVALFMASFGVLALDGQSRFVAVTVYIGIAVAIEGVLISLLLPVRRTIVPTFLHALLIRHHELARAGIQRR